LKENRKKIETALGSPVNQVLLLSTHQPTHHIQLCGQPTFFGHLINFTRLVKTNFTDCTWGLFLFKTLKTRVGSFLKEANNYGQTKEY
jgi:hypothetical protein